jgi:hypothetical protein
MNRIMEDDKIDVCSMHDAQFAATKLNGKKSPNTDVVVVSMQEGKGEVET